MAAIEQHYSTVRLTIQLAIFYNIIIGFIYIIFPYVLGLVIETLFVPDFHWLTKIVIILLGLSFTCGVYFTNHVCVSITAHNDLILKFLLRTLCINKKLKLAVKLKLENLMVRLIYEFIGFYAMNWFKFTKLAFYQFILTISSAYILVKTNMLKWIIFHKTLSDHFQTIPYTKFINVIIAFVNKPSMSLVWSKWIEHVLIKTIAVLDQRNCDIFLKWGKTPSLTRYSWNCWESSWKLPGMSNRKFRAIFHCVKVQKWRESLGTKISM